MTPALDTLLLALATHGEAAAQPCLFLGAQPHPDLPPATVGWQPLKPLADAWTASGRELASDLPGTRFPLVLLLPGKSRDETLAWFAIARDHVQPGGRIVVAMPNTAGASRFEKELATATGSITSLQKHKCRCFQASADGTWDEACFDAWRDLARRQTIPGTDYQTEPGVFSAGHIDPGSQLLAKHLPPSLRGRVADLGAGWGFLSDHILRRCPQVTRIDLYEADARALDCARANLAAHPQEKIGFHWHDVRVGIPAGYDAIVMNPPFHSGQHTDIDLGRAFITTAANALRRGGQLLLVANRQLPYEAALDTDGLRWRQSAQSDTFKILQATKP